MIASQQNAVPADSRSPRAARFTSSIILILLMAAAQMASRPAVAATKTLSTMTVSGKVEFEAAYDGITGGLGQVPKGHAPMPDLYVCAWKEIGGVNDFQFTEFPQEYGDDQLLGCARTDAVGAYSIAFAIPALYGSPLEVYLETSLCDDDPVGVRSASDVCIRINSPEGNEDTPENVKAIWSRSYQIALAPKATLSWNLSCPDVSGAGAASVICIPGQTEPDDWDNGCPCEGYAIGGDTCPVKCHGNCGDTNSRTGCNKEAVHAFRAAVEAYKTWGNTKPNAGNTFSKSCPDSSGIGFCDADECQDEVKFHLSRVQLDASEDHVAGGGVASCDPSSTQNGAEDYDKICIATPLNPFRVAHELGHVADMRWRCDTAGHGDTETTDVPERRAVREGFANFFSVSAWFNADATDPVYCQSTSLCESVESASALAAHTQGEEESVTQFFWDLRDSNDDGGHEVDTERWTLQQIRNVFSAFPYGCEDMQTREGYTWGDSESCTSNPVDTSEDGANVWDFTYYWKLKRGLTDNYCELMRLDLVQGHERCEACALLCH